MGGIRPGPGGNGSSIPRPRDGLAGRCRVAPRGRERTASAEASSSWSTTNEVVRDLARHVSPLEQPIVPSAQTVDDLRLDPRFQADPEAGRAANWKVPGGFRRQHVLQDNPSSPLACWPPPKACYYRYFNACI